MKGTSAISPLTSNFLFSDCKDIDAAQLVALYRQAPWANTRNIEDAHEMLSHTDVVITAWNENRLVGLGRVLTDYVYRASIWDVIVDTTYQGQDIGTEIIQRILQHPDLKRVELFWLCTRSPDFYEKLGFSSKEQTGMVWVRSKHARQE
jgi:N-acetylglutamate synthase-like GNAT family acetyltransferase